MRRVTACAAVFVGVLWTNTSCAHAQQAPKPPKPQPAPALMLAPLAGAPIAVLPVTYLVADSGIAGLPATRAGRVAWADSVLEEAFLSRGPEAKWIWPAELRRIARRAPGMVADPDQMGQSVMRSPNLKKVFDPLLANLRSLVAMTNGRFVMIPAEIRFTNGAGGVTAEMTLVLADARSGSVAWRSVPIATATTASAALAATVAWILPDQH